MIFLQLYLHYSNVLLLLNSAYEAYQMHMMQFFRTFTKMDLNENLFHTITLQGRTYLTIILHYGRYNVIGGNIFIEFMQITYTLIRTLYQRRFYYKDI